MSTFPETKLASSAVAVVVSLMASVVCAGEAHYIGAKTSQGVWAATANWADGAVPAADGSDTAVFDRSGDGVSVARQILIKKSASVQGMTLYQNDSGGAASFCVYPNQVLSIGSGGIRGISNGLTSGENLPSLAEGVVELASSQLWQLDFGGMQNIDKLFTIKTDIVGGADVNWALAGSKMFFRGGTSEGFLGTTYLRTQAVLERPEQFNRLGRQVVICDTNCFGATVSAEVPTITFYHLSSGTGYVDTAIHFDATNITGSSAAYTIGIPVKLPESVCSTVFRGAWTGNIRSGGDVFRITACGNMYQAYGAGAQRGGCLLPDSCTVRLENDMSGLTVWPSDRAIGKGTLRFDNAIFIVASDRTVGGANGPKSSNVAFPAGVTMGAGYPGRIQGLLTVDGVDVNPNNKDVMYMTSSVSVGSGATVLVGLSEPGSANFGLLRCSGATSSGGEAPLWLYAVPGGTCRFSGSFTYSGARYLPVQVWGGGTIIKAESFYASVAHPIWVRDGRFVAGTRNATLASNGSFTTHVDVQVGVSHPQFFQARAMTMDYLDNKVNVKAYDGQTLTFKAAPSIDGVAVAEGDTVLVNCPSGLGSPSGSIYNGLWTVGADTKVWTRHADFNEADECLPDTRVDVEEGGRYAGTRWFLNNDTYRIRERRGESQMMTFTSHEYTPTFLQERNPDPETAFLLADSVYVTNAVIVVDNQSSGDSTLGAYTEGGNPDFRGPVSVFKSHVTLAAPAGATCKFSGSLNGTFGVKKTGAGTVVVQPGAANCTITNLVMSDGALSVPAAALAAGLDAIELPFTAGANAALEVSGDVDLSGMTFAVTGLCKPPRGTQPDSYSFTVSSSTGGQVTGEPTVTLGGDSANWCVLRKGNTWTVGYSIPRLCVIVR